jgi:uncharacterized protein YjbJ (UPF0337 family)
MAQVLHGSDSDNPSTPVIAVRPRSAVMNWGRIEGSWRLMAGRIKQRWGRLTADSATEVDGLHDELVGKVQQAYGLSRDEAERQIKDWETRH